MGMVHMGISWISLCPLSSVGPISSLPHSLLVAGVSACWCIGGSHVHDWVLRCVLAHSRWLLARARAPWLCQASAWGVMCPGVSGLWIHGWICSVVDGCWRGLEQVCGSSHSLLHISMERPYIHKLAHTYTHRCLDSGVHRYTDVLY
ncbi:hypothetical protein AMECASPLE_025070 [Ameca splendens]|uniref:Uncharacterized protein n=1 Tax=Ameca splendens TaxID=208324 RepID=A0ABV1A0U9_9TELE